MRAQKKKVKQKDEEKAVKKERKPVDNSGRIKPFGLTSWTPVDDVYVARYYPRPVFPAVDAILKLKRNQQLDATPLDQLVYLDLKLDMTLEKKKKLESFVSTVQLPHPFLTGRNTVVVFTEDPEQARIAREHGAQFVGGSELVDKILDDKLSADFYISVPEMLEKLFPLKNKLRKQFPKNKRGSVGVNIPKMLSMFKTGFQYMVENECYIKTQIATLDMPTESIVANMQTIVTDVCSYRPAEHGPFIERAIVASRTSEALRFNSQDLLPPPSLEEES
ncbi:hypothetical protein CRUP_020316 [Coryphaenoides rupestris]|nr:hypothetical protein CRUP_020316 [Coryphaenoides rupestris]